MPIHIRYRGRDYTEEHTEAVRTLIARNPGAARKALAKKLCVEWDWKQPNGQLCVMVCHGFLLKLHRQGLIELPAPRSRPPNPLAGKRKRPAFISVDRSPIRCKLKELGKVEIYTVKRTPVEPLVNSLIEHNHYLGYCHPVGEQMKYLVRARCRPIACLIYSSAPRHLGCRDRFIGWSGEQRGRNIRLIAYQSRFLILPWVEVRYLASHLLARISKRISADWEAVYRHPVYFLETFTDPLKYKGTCYRAAGWRELGKTTGRGKDDQTNRPNRSIKKVWGYPLSNDFPEVLWEYFPA